MDGNVTVGSQGTVQGRGVVGVYGVIVIVVVEVYKGAVIVDIEVDGVTPVVALEDAEAVLFLLVVDVVGETFAEASMPSSVFSWLSLYN